MLTRHLNTSHCDRARNDDAHRNRTTTIGSRKRHRSSAVVFQSNRTEIFDAEQLASPTTGPPAVLMSRFANRIVQAAHFGGKSGDAHHPVLEAEQLAYNAARCFFSVGESGRRSVSIAIGASGTCEISASTFRSWDSPQSLSGLRSSQRRIDRARRDDRSAIRRRVGPRCSEP